jgi:glycosyltransferase involved in cell wall biosynthesis
MSHRFSIDSPKVLVVSGTPPPFSGPEVMTAHLLNSQLKEQYQLIHFNISKGRGVETKARFDWVNIAYGLWQPLQLFGLLLRHRPALVYSNLAQTLGGFLRYAVFILIASLFRTPVVVRVMGDGFNHFYARSHRLFRPFIRLVLAQIDGYIIRAEVLKAQFAGLVSTDRLHVVHSGIDVHEFERARHRSEGSPLRVLFVGYLTQAKGALDLLQAVPEIVASYSNVCFQLMGPRLDIERNITYHPVQKSNNSELDRLLADPCIARHVELLAVQSGTAKVDFFVNADIFVLPSYSEAFPTVVLEAMAASLPVVATPVGALPEIFDKKSMLFVEPGDIAGLAQAILQLLREPQLRAEMGRYNYELAHSNFDLASHARQVAHVFNKWVTPAKNKNKDKQRDSDPMTRTIRDMD